MLRMHATEEREKENGGSRELASFKVAEEKKQLLVFVNEK